MLYIDVDIDVDMVFKHWQRHTAYAPKGYLRNILLKMLSEKEMSGSEIMSAIEKETQGRWRPSPGSVYPLLAWLVDNNFIKESQITEEGIKRYTLTEKGKEFLKEAKKKKMEFEGTEFMIPPMMTWGRGMALTEEDIQLRKSFGRLFLTVLHFRMAMSDMDSKEKLKEINKIIEESAAKVEEIVKKSDSGAGSNERKEVK
jgi:DNA-binding PadR family transcriptional regulator